MPRIFISYRRAVSAYQARALYDRLTAAFGKGSVFLDIDAIPPGETFESYILKRIEDSDVFLALLAQGTLNRIHQPDDWVRREIAYALSLPHLRVIPVRVDGFLPAASDLPDELQPLLARNAVRLEHELFEETSERLIRYIRESLPESKPRRANWGRLAAALMIVVGVIVAGLVALNATNQGAPAPTDDLTAEVALLPTETASPTPTDAPSPTSAPTDPPTLTATDAPTATNTPAPTDPPTLTATDAPTATNTPAPTATPTDAPTATNTATFTIEPPGSSLANPITANNQWTPQFETFGDGVVMALVPAGCFMMGSDTFGDLIHEQCLEPFYIDHTEVTQADFERLGGVKANANYFDGEDRPVESINWFEARDFCALRGARLPTEAEWEYAARGPDGLVYPWGNQFISNNVVNAENASGQGTSDVGSRPGGASWVGAYDLSGNVWEWVSSVYANYPYDPTDGREETNRTDISHMVRGGSWDDPDLVLRVAFRGEANPNDTNLSWGFRCARS